MILLTQIMILLTQPKQKQNTNTKGSTVKNLYIFLYILENIEITLKAINGQNK